MIVVNHYLSTMSKNFNRVTVWIKCKIHISNQQNYHSLSTKVSITGRRALPLSTSMLLSTMSNYLSPIDSDNYIVYH